MQREKRKGSRSEGRERRGGEGGRRLGEWWVGEEKKGEGSRCSEEMRGKVGEERGGEGWGGDGREGFGRIREGEGEEERGR